MPGFLGGSTGGGGGTGGEIRFPKEFVDPVTKLRVSTPENLIDTDFEYGLQPTKWETVELINNTPSFFSKSGDTTIPGITAITTNAGTREIIVKTSLGHGLAAGIPINVTGSKSVTADGAYIISSIPDETTFTYLCRDTQPETSSIEDLYTSIITGEFFQGSQLRLSDSAGITTDGDTFSELTVTTNSPHGFGTQTPFYFLNLNSTISQEFAATNTETKSFDSSNSATAQTFDGSNTLSSLNIDWSNSATIAGIDSDIDSANIADDTIVVVHGGTENFVGLPTGAPLYYSIVAAGGYFLTNPRGVLFLGEASTLGTSQSTIQLTDTPGGNVIDIQTNLAGKFKIANQARVFAGNNRNPEIEVLIDLVNEASKTFDGDNSAGLSGTVTSYSSSNVTIQAAEALDWYQGTMLLYNTDGAAASGLTNNTTYFIDFFIAQPNNIYTFTLKPLPTSSAISTISGGSGTQTFKQIGVSIDKDVFHLKDNGYLLNDMLRYDYPIDGRIDADEDFNFYFVKTSYDQHNFNLSHTLGQITPATISRVGTDWGDPMTPTVVNAIGFVAPLSFAVTSGVLPTGLTLNTSTGVVSGTPGETIANPGREVVITLTDSEGSQAIQTHTYQYNQPPFLYEFSSATFTSGGASGRFGPSVSQMRNGVGNPSWASTYLNTGAYQGQQDWTVPINGTYRITANGAAGGRNNSYGERPGYGTRMRGDFTLTQGQIVRMVVGHQPGSFSSGCSGAAGGGGTYVTVSPHTNSSSILVIAGGGGGVGTSGSRQGIDASTGQSGTNDNGNQVGGGSNGNGGNQPPGTPCSLQYVSGSGGGFFTSGAGPNGGQSQNGNTGGGGSYLFGSLGGSAGSRQGAEGVFGGGGQGSFGAGAGGGYSGGGGGRGDSCSCNTWRGGGGGGSINNGSNQSNSSTANSGNGSVIIQKL
jgi:hypothetical protein